MVSFLEFSLESGEVHHQYFLPESTSGEILRNSGEGKILNICIKKYKKLNKMYNGNVESK